MSYFYFQFRNRDIALYYLKFYTLNIFYFFIRIYLRIFFHHQVAFCYWFTLIWILTQYLIYFQAIQELSIWQDFTSTLNGLIHEGRLIDFTLTSTTNISSKFMFLLHRIHSWMVVNGVDVKEYIFRKWKELSWINTVSIYDDNRIIYFPNSIRKMRGDV